MDNSILNKTKSLFRAVGILSESDLMVEDTEIKVLNPDRTVKMTMPGKRIRGKISLDIGGGIKTFDAFCQNLTSKGEENKQWKAFESMLKWNPKIDGDPEKEPSKVEIKGTVGVNDYVGQDGNVHTALRWMISGGNSKVAEDEPLGCSANLTGFVRKITPEIRNEEETGRYNLELLGVDFKGAIYPFTAIIDAEDADNFSDIYEVGNTANFDIDVNMVHVGEKKGAKKAFGKAASTNITSGYDVEERIVVGGDAPIEQPEEDDEGNFVDNGWLNPEAIKKAIKERDKMLEELKKNPPVRTTSSNPTPKQSKFAKKPDMDDEDDFGF